AIPLAADEIDDAAMNQFAESIGRDFAQLHERSENRPDLNSPAPDRVGPYEILGVIGRGGMGVVYRALQTSLERPVQLKSLREGRTINREALKGFEREAKAIARLKHPNVVQLFDFGEWGKAPFIAMESVEGENLATKLSKGPLLLRDAAELVRTLAGALAYA